MSEPAANAEPLPPDPFAVVLSRLEPAPHGFDRDALMFAAGRESKARALLFWKRTTAAALATAAVFATLYFTRPTKTEIIERPRVVDPARR